MGILWSHVACLQRAKHCAYFPGPHWERKLSPVKHLPWTRHCVWNFRNVICLIPHNKLNTWTRYYFFHFQMRKTEAQGTFPRPRAENAVELKFKSSLSDPPSPVCQPPPHPLMRMWEGTEWVGGVEWSQERWRRGRKSKEERETGCEKSRLRDRETAGEKERAWDNDAEKDKGEERVGRGQREGEPASRWWAKSRISVLHWGFSEMTPFVCWRICFYSSGCSSRFLKPRPSPVVSYLLLFSQPFPGP